MGNSLYQWRVTVGMFYCRCQRIRLLRKVSIHFLLQFCFIRLTCRFLKVIIDVAISEKMKFLNENFYVTMVQILLIIDLNEDLLNPNDQNLKNVLLINSLNNIITEPTRGRALLDPVLTSFEQTVLDSGILQVPLEISDHFATFVTLPFEYSVHHTYKRKIWIYRQANYNEIETRINNFDWSPLHTLHVPLDDAVLFFNDTFLKFVNECIPSKEVTVRSDDKSWYDTEIRKHSRKRDRLKTIAFEFKSSVGLAKIQRF